VHFQSRTLVRIDDFFDPYIHRGDAACVENEDLAGRRCTYFTQMLDRQRSFDRGRSRLLSYRCSASRGHGRIDEKTDNSVACKHLRGLSLLIGSLDQLRARKRVDCAGIRRNANVAQSCSQFAASRRYWCRVCGRHDRLESAFLRRAGSDLLAWCSKRGNRFYLYFHH